jgi:PAS domain S-box-containing protein
MVKAMVREKEKFKILTIVILLGISCFLTYYFQIVLKTGIIYTHFFYIPIVLSCIWWKRKGLPAAIFLAVLLIFSRIFLRDDAITINDYLRAIMFIAIACVVATLSEKITKGHEEIEKQKNFSENIITTIPQSLVILDKDLRIKKANRTFYKVFQTKPEKAIGSSLCDLLPDKDGKLRSELTRIAGTENILEDFEILYQSKKLGERVLNIIAKGMIIEEEVILIQDITERKRMEEKIRELNEKLNLLLKQRTKELIKEQKYTNYLLENSPDFQITVDNKGKILGVNRACEEIIRKEEKEELIGSSIYKYLPKERIKKIIDKVLNEKQVRNFEVTINISEKGPLIFDFSGTAFIGLQGETGIYLSGRDITERRKLQQNLKELNKNLEKKVIERTKKLRETQDQLIQSEKLSIIGQLATGVAHEIRNPLTIINLTTQQLKGRTYNDFHREKVQIVKKNIGRIDKIIQGLLTFSRPSSSNFTYEDINKIVYKLKPTMENIYQKSIKVIKKYNSTIPKLCVNPDQLEEIFLNLTTNAMQSMKDGGKLYISTDYSSDRKGIEVKFRDTGCGISEENLKKIFHPFFTTRGEGTGLGLSISQKIINEHNGNISVESKVGKGTIFTIFLPLEKRR